jgi:DNA-binding transcriptional MerR regulator
MSNGDDVNKYLKAQMKKRPPIRKDNKMAIIREAYPSILEMQEKGFSIEGITKILNDSGKIVINVTTLKSYLHRIKVEIEKKSHPSARRLKDSEEPFSSAKEAEDQGKKESKTDSNIGAGKFSIKEDSKDL